MATKTNTQNEQNIVEMLASMQAKIDSLESQLAAKPERKSRIDDMPKMPVEMLKTPSLAAVLKVIGKPESGKCHILKHPTNREYELGKPLVIRWCSQNAIGDTGICEHHTGRGDMASRHTQWQTRHARLFPVWQAVTGKGGNNAK